MLALTAVSMVFASCEANAGDAVHYQEISVELPLAVDADGKTADGIALDPRFARLRALHRLLRDKAVSETSEVGLSPLTSHDPGWPEYTFIGAVTSERAVIYRTPALDQTAEGRTLIADDEPHTIQVCRITIDFDALPARSDYSTYLKLHSLFPDADCEKQTHPAQRPVTAAGDGVTYRVFASAVVGGQRVAVIERADEANYKFNPFDAVAAAFDSGEITRAVPLPLSSWRGGLVEFSEGPPVFFTGPGPSYEFERICAVQGLSWGDISHWRSLRDEAVRRFCDEQLTKARWAYQERFDEVLRKGDLPPIRTQKVAPIGTRN